MIGSGTSRTIATVTGFLLVIGAMAMRFVRAGNATPDRRKYEQTLLALYAVGLGAVLLYVIQSDLWASAFGKPLERNWPKLSTVLGALWPVAWIAAAWPVLLIELAYAEMARAPRLELGRIRSAMLSGSRPGRHADRRGLVRLRGLGARQEARPRVLPHLASGRGDPPDRAQPGSADRDRRLLPDGQRGARRGGRLPRTTWSRRPARSSSRTTTSTSTRSRRRSTASATNGIVVFVRGSQARAARPAAARWKARKTALKTLDKEVQQRLLTW